MFLTCPKFTGIECRELFGTSDEVDATIQHLLALHPELQSFAVFNSECTDASLRLLVNHGRMRKLQLSLSHVTGEDILVPPKAAATAVSQSHLRTEFKTESPTTNNDLRTTTALVRKNASSRIEYLDLSASKVTDRGLLNLLRLVGPSLRILLLKGTDSISLDELAGEDGRGIGMRLPRLEKLYLDGCMNLSDAAVTSLLARLGPSLRILNLSGTNVSLDEIRLVCVCVFFNVYGDECIPVYFLSLIYLLVIEIII